ncbi:nucleotide exchange factor GrpE [Thermophilibacter sp. ZX-H3]|uniref:nucleotide exchange factor GrpE n=1 Tax=unclassified Thermophilibacter TaxID=2847308 RepID=UPI004040A91F
MKVPIEVEDEKNEAMEPEPVEPEVVEPESEEAEAVVEDVDPDEERARVEAAIRAGEEAAERELAADASKIREERDELQKKLADVEDQIEAAKKEASEATERMLRLQADWDNYRRRTAAERLAEKERAAEKLVTNLLPVIDDIERAIEHAGVTEGDTQFQQFVDGVSAVHAKMLGVLEKEGVEPIDPVGEPFEPLAHQAVGRVEDKDAFDETVAQVYQKGYKMGDKVIRTAMVTVTYGGPKRPAEEE